MEAGDGRVLSRAENHLGSPVHHQAITHGAEASARKKKKGGQRAAGHIQLLTPLPNAAKSGREQSRFRWRCFVTTITCGEATLEPCSESHTSIRILPRSRLVARCTNLNTASVTLTSSSSTTLFLTANRQTDAKGSTIYRTYQFKHTTLMPDLNTPLSLGVR